MIFQNRRRIEKEKIGKFKNDNSENNWFVNDFERQFSFFSMFTILLGNDIFLIISKKKDYFPEIIEMQCFSLSYVAHIYIIYIYIETVRSGNAKCKK